MDDRVIPDEVGTSPRMRGKLPRYNSAPCRFRNIPAYAGKTGFCMIEKLGLTEHPRVCGENRTCYGGTRYSSGTSPRMRGKRCPTPPRRPRRRNIPAYAGKTSPNPQSDSPLSEHPRVCGENGLALRGGDSTPGTSPRMRGKPHRHRYPTHHPGNIPAYAGKTVLRITAVPEDAEHPRVCGENVILFCTAYGSHGTSPRMRGKRGGAAGSVLLERNIPAYAGKTNMFAITPMVSAEHPRVCGENPRGALRGAAAHGTSPRMRGKPLPISPRRYVARNIPAYAGKTRSESSKQSICWEHPRVCGENRP